MDVPSTQQEEAILLIGLLVGLLFVVYYIPDTITQLMVILLLPAAIYALAETGKTNLRSGARSRPTFLDREALASVREIMRSLGALWGRFDTVSQPQASIPAPPRHVFGEQAAQNGFRYYYDDDGVDGVDGVNNNNNKNNNNNNNGQDRPIPAGPPPTVVQAPQQLFGMDGHDPVYKAYLYQNGWVERLEEELRLAREDEVLILRRPWLGRSEAVLLSQLQKRIRALRTKICNLGGAGGYPLQATY